MITDMDLYASRVGSSSRIVEREDPVVYGTQQGPLTEEQLQFYDRTGYLYLENFFQPAEVDQMKWTKDQLWHDSQHDKRPEVIREWESEIIRSIFAVHRNSPYFSKLASSERLKAIAGQILGSDTYITQSRINYKSGFYGEEFYWHSDFETWHVEDGMPRMRSLSMSIALTPNYPHNGPVMVIPGSHRYFVSCIGQTPKNHFTQSLRKQMFGTPDTESVEWLVKHCQNIQMPTGDAGSLLLFDCNIMHGSNSNISPDPRSNVFFVFNSVDNRLQAPFSGQAPRPEYIATRP